MENPENIFKKFVYTGVGFLSLTADKFKTAIDELVSDNKLSESEGKKIIQVLYNPRTSSTRIKQNTIDQSHIKNYIEQANGIVIRRNIEPGHELITSRNALKITQCAFDSASTSCVYNSTQHPPQILPE